LPNEDLLIISSEAATVNFTALSYTKLFLMSKNGQLKDSIIFKDSIRSLDIFKIIPTNYGYCLLGSKKENNQYFFWNAKLDAQFRITSQQFTSMNTNLIIAESYTITRDSSIVVLIAFPPFGAISYCVAKINKNGEYMFNTSSPYTSVPVSIFERRDSSGYFIVNEFEWMATDSLFNTLHRKNINFSYNGASFSPNFQPTVLKKNDSTYFYSGRWLQGRIRNNRDLVFMVINPLGQPPKYVKTTMLAGDTSLSQAGVHCIDTTKDGRFIYWGGCTNYDITNVFSQNRGSLILTKLDSAYQTVWQKRYGANAYYFMEGVLPTKDGGCLMYARRYDYNNTPKFDAVIIKVDGNGVVTSTTTIPMPQSSIIAYPNPSNGLLNFKKGDPSVSGTFEVNIFDISGKLVFQKSETELSETFDLSHFAEGNYIYQIKQREQIISIGKWVKTK
jgi:Secretion system C-terminal sorting domain